MARKARKPDKVLVRKIARVRSFSHENVEYVVARAERWRGGQLRDIAWQCTCPSFVFGGGKPCKHLKALWFGDLDPAKRQVRFYPHTKQLCRAYRQKKTGS